MKHRLLLILPLFWVACQTDNAVVPGLDPGEMAYNDEAGAVRKLYCNSGKCEDPLSIEEYKYDASRRLIRVNRISRNAKGSLEVFSYDELTYDEAGRLVRKTNFFKAYNLDGWTPGSVFEFEYEGGSLKTERQYQVLYPQNQLSLIGTVRYGFRDGKKVLQESFDLQNRLSTRVEYEYRKNVLSRESYYNGEGKLFRKVEHSFAGNRRVLNEYWSGQDKPISSMEKRYDDQRRLSAEETKVMNPLLCAMLPGWVRYEY
ncbi:hypothetical protein [Larkinella soli]|uniref:hypothetical protein n=1 Tax=Larkinella soli TaxID=1770527 RepID=UPI000FFB1AA6|nr:hypothetical protein [Larkinella soli]